MGCSLLEPAATGVVVDSPPSRAAPQPNFQQFWDFTLVGSLGALISLDLFSRQPDRIPKISLGGKVFRNPTLRTATGPA
jgi:hypothetical protein